MIFTVSVLCVAITASAWDYKTYRIPNWLTLGAVTFGLLLSFTGEGAPGGVVDSLKGFLVGGLIILPFFMLGAMGGGDVKLAAAFGALGGLYFVINTLFVGSILGGAFAFVYLLCRQGLGGAFKKVYHDLVALIIFRSVTETGGKDMVLPYGIFISIGAGMSLFYEVIKIAG